jgi:hypothetical protein
MKRACTIEVLAVQLRYLTGSVDGAQKASNETKNSVMRFGEAATRTLDSIDKNMPRLLENQCQG